MCAKCTNDTTHMLPKRVCEMHCEVVNASNNVVDVHCEVRLGSALLIYNHFRFDPDLQAIMLEVHCNLHAPHWRLFYHCRSI